MKLHLLSSPVLALLVSACSSSSNEAPEGATDVTGEDRVHPTGPDDAPGSLLVQSARTPVTGEVYTLSPRTGGASIQRTLDTELTNVPVGANSWSLSVGNGSFSASTTIATGARSTVRLGALILTRAGAPATIGGGSTYGGSLTTATVVGDTTFNSGSFISYATDPGTASTHVAPGEYTFSWGIADGRKINVAAGSVTTQALFAHEGRRIARIPAPTRELPNACSENAPRLYYQTSAAASYYGGNPIPYDTEVGQASFTAQYLYTVTLPCISDYVPVALGAVGAGPLDMKVGRIDVDDVTVTNVDGSSHVQRGTYVIVNAASGRTVTATYPTNTGIDVLPGTYNVVATYTTSAGTTKTTTSSVTVH